jgi:hypothetical protein
MCLRHLAIKKEGEAVRIVPCGKCHQCLGRRSGDWAFRLEQEQKRSDTSCFLTLTYETTPLSPNGIQTLHKKEFPQFIKRLRAQIQYATKYSRKSASIKYYAVGEYGTAYQRPHYHAIIFNLPQQFLDSSEDLHRLWGLGHIQIDPCNGATIRYVTNYITTTDKPLIENGDDRIPQFSTMSKNMGANYLTEAMKHHHRSKLINYITKPNGQIQALPRYYKDKLFDDEMKEILAEQAEFERTINFEKLFNSNKQLKLSWKNDQRRQQKKLKKLARAFNTNSTRPRTIMRENLLIQ